MRQEERFTPTKSHIFPAKTENTRTSRVCVFIYAERETDRERERERERESEAASDAAVPTGTQTRGQFTAFSFMGINRNGPT